MQTKSKSESKKKITSPEELNDYIKVSSGGVWIVIAAAAVLLICFGVWMILGNITSTVKVNGVAKEGSVVCYASDLTDIAVGSEVKLSDGSKGKITDISEKPLSKKAVEDKYGDLIAYQLSLSELNYEIIVSSEGTADGVLSAAIIVENIRPVSFIWN